MSKWKVDGSFGEVREDHVRFLCGNSRNGTYITIDGNILSGGSYLERIRGKRFFEEEFSKEFDSYADAWGHLMDSTEETNQLIQLLANMSSAILKPKFEQKKYTAGNRKRPGKYKHDRDADETNKMIHPDWFIEMERDNEHW